MSNVKIYWNGGLIADGNISRPVSRTLTKLETNIRAGAKAGAKETIDYGVEIAQQTLMQAEAFGPKYALFDSIHADINSRKDTFYLIAGSERFQDQKYPLYIEKGFRPHWRSIESPGFEEWLAFKNPTLLAIAKARGGLVVGRDPKWRIGVRYMEGAYNVMKTQVVGNIKDEILKNIRNLYNTK